MTLPATRQQAVEQGALKYQSTRPCSRGHIGARYTSSYNCVECSKIVMTERYKHKSEEIKQYVRQWINDNADYHRPYAYERRFLKTYGITLEQRNKMIEQQDGKCAICSDVLTAPHVDHCHETNAVRGILCNVCNIGLGYFKDDPLRLQSAIEYLEVHDAKK